MDLFEELSDAIERLLKEPVGSRKVRISDLTPRDGQQSKLATRARTEDLIPLCASLDKCGFYAVEVWGGATFDVSLRYLHEAPFESLRQIKAVMPTTRLQMLLRGQSLVAYKPHSDKTVHKFCERAFASGIEVFRIFDATNDFRNIEVPLRAAKALGAEAHVEIAYTTSPFHMLDVWLRYTDQLLGLGADWITFKDAAGIIAPLETYRLIRGMKARVGDRAPIAVHIHDMGGMASMSQFLSILGGSDMIDTVMSPLAFGSSHPATESMVAALAGTPFDPGIDLNLLKEPAALTRALREKYKRYSPAEHLDVTSDVLVHKIPGGMMANLVENLKEIGQLDKLDAVLKEVPAVAKDLGYPPLFTPTSQIVGVQATLNVTTGARYQVITKETREYVLGRYGTPLGAIDEDLRRRVLGDAGARERETDGDHADASEWDRTAEALAGLAKDDEDLLMGVLFPRPAKELLTAREAGLLLSKQKQVAREVEAEPPSPVGAYELAVGAERFRVEVIDGRVPAGAGPHRTVMRIDGRFDEVQVRRLPGERPHSFEIESRNTKYRVHLQAAPADHAGGLRRYDVRIDGEAFEVTTTRPDGWVAGASPRIPRPDAQPGDLKAKVAGRVIQLHARVGERVTAGQIAAVVEAMKLQTEVRFPVAGTVEAVYVQAGDVISSEDALLRVV